MVGASGQPKMTATARQAAMSLTPEPASRVMKKSTEAVTWLRWPKRWPRNS